MKHYRIRVTGIVQGVWFRKSTKEKAEELGLKGMVRNMPDGSVLIEAEGTAGTLAKFLSWCNHGPENARVTTLNMTEYPLKHYNDFTIQR